MEDLGLKGEYLSSPKPGRTITPLLTWIGLWRAVPEASQLLVSLFPMVQRARKSGYLTRVDTVVGPAYGLTVEGERFIGTQQAVRRMSGDSLNTRVLLHLITVTYGLPVVGFTRNGLTVELNGKAYSLGWCKGDLTAGLPDSGVDYPLALPHECRFPEARVSDGVWLAVAPLVLPPPAVPMRSHYWSRTLFELAYLRKREGSSHPLIAGLDHSTRLAVDWFERKRVVSWERVYKHLR